MFQPKVGLVLDIDSDSFSFVAHPSAPKIPYGQEGRQAVVFKMEDASGEPYALKVFKPRFRRPYLVALAERMRRYADLPGMIVCRRKIINPLAHKEILREHPDLSYAAIMPWIEGPTWSEVLLSRRVLEEETCLRLAGEFLEILLNLEEKGISHGDLSGVNIILPCLAEGSGVFLVDVEQMYIPGGEKPDILPGSSPGYAKPEMPKDQWGPFADRYAGSILLGEMLSLCEKEVVKASWGESYFSPEEVGKETPRFRLMERVLGERYNEQLAAVFRRNWFAEDLESCSTFAEWYIYIPERVKGLSDKKGEPGVAATVAKRGLPKVEWDLDGLLGRAHELFAGGDYRGAVELYQYILNVYSLPEDFQAHLKREIDTCKERFSASGSKAEDAGETELGKYYPLSSTLESALSIAEAQKPIDDESIAGTDHVEGDFNKGVFPAAEAVVEDFVDNTENVLPAREGTALNPVPTSTEKLMDGDAVPGFIFDEAAGSAGMQPKVGVDRLSTGGGPATFSHSLAVEPGQDEEESIEEELDLPHFLVEAKPVRAVSMKTVLAILVPLLVMAIALPALLISGRKTVEKVEVPDLINLNLEEASSRLEECGLKAGDIEYRETDEAQPGTILDTVPEPGSTLERGSTVDLRVATEPRHEEEVGVAGKTTCPQCLGRGHVTCPRCQGRVYLSDGSICGLCHGKREITCPTCGGMGYVEK